ncbi:NAC domain containing protein 50-like [Quercus lobata]|uniref:NAC domain containing protein 50-like n=1 Tax=Quercus lobata TaxID=97700 RepID=UPI00124869A3|nr:NAC domain containing protein 50-like [Quercus lobata]
MADREETERDTHSSSSDHRETQRKTQTRSSMAITVPVASKKKKKKIEDMIMENELPVGFRFNPTDDELVTHFLRNRNLGKPTPFNAVKECDLYGKKEPWEIWDMFSAVDGSRVVRELYFFTKLKTYNNGRRIDRRVGSGSGTWKKEHQLKTPGLVGVEKSRFTYENNDDKSSKSSSSSSSKSGRNGKWNLIEYKDLNPPNQDSNEYVVCRLSYSGKWRNNH